MATTSVPTTVAGSSATSWRAWYRKPPASAQSLFANTLAPTALFEQSEEGPPPSAIERRGMAAARRHIEAKKLHVRLDERLRRVAICMGPLRGHADGDANQLRTLHRCAREQGVTDGELTAFRFEATSSDWLRQLDSEVDALLAADDKITHLGLAVTGRLTTQSGAHTVTAVASRRLLRLMPLPKHIESSRPLLVGGAVLDANITSVQLFVHTPDGAATAFAPSNGHQPFAWALGGQAASGPLTVQLMADRGRGPEVAAQCCVNVGQYSSVRSPAHAEAPMADSSVCDSLQRLRQQRHVRRVSFTAALNAIATAHAHDMAQHHYFAHRSPAFGDAAQRTERAGIVSARLVENLAIAHDEAEAFELWSTSPSHRVNLLDPYVRDAGFGQAPLAPDSALSVYVLLMAQPELMVGRGGL